MNNNNTFFIINFINFEIELKVINGTDLQIKLPSKNVTFC